MFLSEAGARPRACEPTASERRKWVECLEELICQPRDQAAKTLGVETRETILTQRLYCLRIETRVFKACDEDNKGYLSREDFKVAIVMLFGYKPSKIEADSVMSAVNPSTSGISLEGFLNVVKRKKEAQLFRNEIRHIFTAFDVHYRGFLTLEDFKRAFSRAAPRLPVRTVLEVFRETDRDSDGHVSFRDFEYAMNYGQAK